MTGNRFGLALRLFSFAVPFLLFVFIDQATKYLIVSNFVRGIYVVLIPEVLYLVYTENSGVAFGLLKGYGFIFTFVAFIVSVGLFIYAMILPGGKRFRPLRLALVLIAAGACGNAIDRIVHGYVVDFIYFKPIDFPVFNFADICVTIGFALLIVLLVFIYKDSDFLKLSVFHKTDHVEK